MSEDRFLDKYGSKPTMNDNLDSLDDPEPVEYREKSEPNGPTIRLSIGAENVEIGTETSEAEKHDQSEHAWIPPNQEITVNGYDISDGMIYVGTELRSPQRYGGSDSCLLNPSLEVDPTSLDPNGTRMSYWPSYSGIDPGCRATYLEWLANDRRDPDIDIGYVFLFFYGIERRVLFDASRSPQAQSEIPYLLTEVEELIKVYSGNHSFHGYATQFLDIARAQYDPDSLATATPLTTEYRREIPLGLKLRIGRQLVDRNPIDSKLAYEWFQQSPNTYLRTPAERCEKEFEMLFLAQYDDYTDDDFYTELDKTTLTISYRPASRSISQQDDIEIDSIPDISALSAPQQKLQKLANKCCEELDAFSRHVGKTQDRDSLEALSLLPKSVLGRRETDSLSKLLRTVESKLGTRNIVDTDFDFLFEHWFKDSGEKVRKRDLRRLAKLLETLGFGIEPDVRFGTPSRGWGDPAVLFRLPAETDFKESEVSEAIRLVQKLAVKVVLANNEVSPEQTEYLAENLGSLLELSEVDRTRLDAHRRWLILDSPTLHGVRSRAEDFQDDQIPQVGKFLTALACSDGEIDPTEIQELSKIYPMIGLEEDLVHTHLHQLQAREPQLDDEPVMIRKPERVSNEYEIPESDDPTEPRSSEIKLDQELVSKTLRDTEEVSEFLTDIFEEESDAQRNSNESDIVSNPDQSTTQELSEDHRQFLIELSQRTHWDREEVEELARERGLFPGAAIEIINDYAFEQVETPIVEGSEELIVDQELSQEVLL